MKVIYDTCFADPWLKVAQKLRQEHGFEPVCWNGYPDDNSKTLVPNAFPHAIYNPYYDVSKGIFTKEIADRFAGSHINIDFLKSNASDELVAIKMMDRMDPDRFSFNFMERQRHYRNFIKYWTACINYLKPDLLVCGNVPHQPFDYVLYLICKYHHIKFVTFIQSAFLGRMIPLTSVSSIGDLFDEEYAKNVRSETDARLFRQNLPIEIIERYDKIKMDYAAAEPDYMKQQLIEHEQTSGFLSLTRKFILDMGRYKRSYFGRDGFVKNGFPTFFKQRKKSIENSRSPLWHYALLRIKADAFKSKLNKYYNSLVSEPDFTVPYVMVNLHYQPEMSSSPSGDIFVDQRLIIELLAKHVPAQYYIYVKEHPSQFYVHSGGHTSRIAEFYDDLIAYPQVRLMPLHVNPFSLYEHARAVATVSGTSGWEAMVLKKPVLNFGLSWYEKYTGVLKVVDEESAAGITPFIDNFMFDERNLLAYLDAVGKKSVRAYAHRGMKAKMNQDEAECVSNLAGSIAQMASPC